MKPVILIPIILGSALLITGGVILGLGIKNSVSSNDVVTNEFKIEEAVNKFDIDIDTANLEFKATEGDAKVVLQERKKLFHETSLQDGVLKITTVDQRPWYEKMFSWGPMKVTVCVPANEYAELKIKIATGNIVVPNDFAFENASSYASTGDLSFKANVKEKLEVKASTGKVNLSDFTAKNIVVNTSTGDISLNSVEVAEKIDVKASTGNIKLTGAKANDFDAKASTGKVTLTNTLVANHINIKTSTGDVKFEDSDADTLSIKTDTGDVKGTLLTSKIFYAKTDTGKINVPKTTEGGLCEIETDTGNINIQIKA